MPRPSFPALGAAVLAVAAFTAPSAQAASQLVAFHNLVASATVQQPLGAGDTLLIDSAVVGETGALLQSVTFSVAPDVGSFSGLASWFVSEASRLTGVNITVAREGGGTVADDSFEGLLAGTAVSSIASSFFSGGGTFTLTATGNAAHAPSLDIALIFAPVPEPATYAMFAAGLGIVGFLARRRRHPA